MTLTLTHRIAVGAVACSLAAAGAVAAGGATDSGSAAVSTPHPVASQTPQQATAQPTLPGGYQHLVVIYEENHSFDNLYGTWGAVNGQRVDGLAQATAAQKTQVGQDGKAFSCLPQNDVNLDSPPLSNTCQDAGHHISASHFGNRPFSIDDYLEADDRTCPAEGASAPNGVLKNSDGAEPGGCTRDLVHRFYQEQYQIDGGKQDRYTTGSDAVGLTQGHYDSRALPIYRYLHQGNAPKYVLADHFFQGAFGGSFINHQFLIAARAPLDTSAGANGAKNSVVDSNGMPNNYQQYQATGSVTDGQLTRKCADTTVNDPVKACGDYAINTVQPPVAPHGNGASIPLIDDAKYPNIGDRLTDAKIDWNWYSGGWDDAEAGHPGALFQYHHQPFNYFADYAPGQPGRAHLKDEKGFITAAKEGHLPTVSFVKPYGAENEHPGYASEPNGSDHLVDLLKTVTNGPQAKKTLVVVAYDEFGGQWDHVAPPTQDAWGPGTRIPALVVSRGFTHSGVDHTTYDTTSILATLEHSFGLAPLSTRDAAVNPLDRAVAAGS